MVVKSTCKCGRKKSICKVWFWRLLVLFQSLEVSIVYEVFDDLDSPDMDYPKPSLGVVAQHQQSGSVGSYSSNASDSMRVRSPLHNDSLLTLVLGIELLEEKKCFSLFGTTNTLFSFVVISKNSNLTQHWNLFFTGLIERMIDKPLECLEHF